MCMEIDQIKPWWFDFVFLHCFRTMSEWSTGFYQLQINASQRYHGYGKKPHQNSYLILNCQLLSLSPFSSLIISMISLLKKISYHIIIDKKGIPQILFFSTQQLFNLNFGNTELLIDFIQVIELLVPLSQFMVLWATEKIGILGKFKN